MGRFGVSRSLRATLLMTMVAGAGAISAAGQNAGTVATRTANSRATVAAEQSGLNPASDPAGQSWVSVGPKQITSSIYGPLSGRVTSIAIDSSDLTGNIVILGTGGGGVWRSVNAAGASNAVKFIPLTDDLAVFNGGGSGEISTASLSVGAVSIQPGGTGVLLAGTGEASPLSDAYYGEGLLRSENNGASWTLVPGSKDGVAGNHAFTGEGFAGFAWSGTTASTVVAAVGTADEASTVNAVVWGASVRGLFVSLDAGATWGIATVEDVEGDGTLQIVQWSESNYEQGYDGNSALAVEWNAARNSFYAVLQYHGVYSSPDGVTWMRVPNQPGPGLGLAGGVCPTDPGYGGSPTCPLAQAALTVEPVSGDMYAWYVDSLGNDRGLWRDNCGLSGGKCTSAVTFSQQIGTAPLEDGAGKVAGGLEHLQLGAAGGKSGTTLLAGNGSGLAACSFTGECEWQTTCGGEVFPGAFAMAVVPGTTTMYVATEGGLWRDGTLSSGCGAADFVNLNGGLGSIALSNSVAASASDASAVLTGAAALGTAGTGSLTVSGWPQVQAGDGGIVALDSVDGIAYAMGGPGMLIARCTQGASCNAADFDAAIGPEQVADDAALEHPPFLLDSVEGGTSEGQIVLGTCRVWRGASTGAGWAAGNVLSPMLDGNQRSSCSGNTEIRSLAVGGPKSANGSQVIYAGMTGLTSPPTANAGHVFVTADALDATMNVPWTDIALSPVTNDFANNFEFNVGEFPVSSVVADVHDPTGGTVYATVMGIGGNGFSVPKVYRSVDFGAHWLNVSSNLPDVPANGLVVDPNDANTVYVALDTGVYFTGQITQCAQENCWQVYGADLPNSPAMAIEADGQQVGMLRVATHGRGVWEIPLATGEHLQATAASLTPGSLAFASQAVGTASTAQAITVTNIGTNALQVTVVVASGDFSESDDCVAASIGPGKACAVAVIFAPTTVGARTGTVTVYANVSGGQVGPANLTGTGAKALQIVISPSGTLNFGDGTVGQTSVAQIVELANVGQTAVTLGSYAITGDFAISANTCGTTLAAQTGCTLALTFTPTASGTRTGTLTITDSAGTQTLALQGIGQAAANVALAPLQMTFASTNIGTTSPVQTATATNSGDESVLIMQVTATGDFAAVSSCAAALSGNSACSIAVSFVPTQAGARTGTLTVVTPFQTVTSSLVGTGVGTAALTLTPESLSFANQNLQQSSAPQAMTLTNTGTAAVTIAGVTTSDVTPGTNDYAATTDCKTLAVGANCSISVTFTPSVAGQDAGTLMVSAGNAGVTAALMGAGNTLSWQPGQTPTASVPSGQTASYALWLEDVGFAGTVAVTCSGLPAGAICNTPRGMVLTAGSGTVSVWVTVATGSQPGIDITRRSRNESQNTSSHNGQILWGWIVLFFPLQWRRWWWTRRGNRERRRIQKKRLVVTLILTGICVAMGGGMAGCGSSKDSAGKMVAPGTYSFTITATGTGNTTGNGATMTATLVVEK